VDALVKRDRDANGKNGNCHHSLFPAPVPRSTRDSSEFWRFPACLA
jgi:hypothetical protein